jgi:NAD(P)-dependent dehydrogenase (short-subunit alcohol dehydrogenase family)
MIDSAHSPPPAFDLSGKVALVTGATRGIGHATVQLLLARGAQVIATDLRDDVNRLACSSVATLVGDVTTEATAVASVELAVERFGRLDIVVNNAGRTLNKPILDTSVADIDALYAVNLRGAFLHAREALRVMLPQRSGVIVNVASVASVVALKDTVAYASSKAALVQLTRSIAIEYGMHGIRANAVAPGVIETDILEDIVPDSRATLASHGPSHPLGRVGQPEEIAEVIAFLASPASRFMTGSLVMADGGYTAA